MSLNQKTSRLLTGLRAIVIVKFLTVNKYILNVFVFMSECVNASVG